MQPIRSIVKKQSPETEIENGRNCWRGHGKLVYDAKHHYYQPESDQEVNLWYCPVCDQLEQEEKAKEQEKKRIEDELKRKEIMNNPEPLLSKIGVGKRHLYCSFENYQGGDKIKSICMDIINNPRDLILSGSAGSGKTHLAVAILREWVRQQRIKVNFIEGNGIFITVPDLLLQIRQVFNDRSDKSEAEIVNKYSKVDYLLLDDLGAEKSTEWSITTLYTIIDQRYRQELPTIVTTNLTIDQIGQQISERIASRLSSGKVIKINAPDYRKKR